MKKLLLTTALLATTMSGSVFATEAKEVPVVFSTDIYGTCSILLDSPSDIVNGIGFYDQLAESTAKVRVGTNAIGGSVDLSVEMISGDVVNLPGGGTSTASLSYQVKGKNPMAGGKKFTVDDAPTGTEVVFNPDFDEDRTAFPEGILTVETVITATCK